MSVTRPPLRYFGSKWQLAPWIIENMPEHKYYIEPYGGGGSVLLRKPRAYQDVYNDLFDEIVQFFEVLQDKTVGQELIRQLRLTPYSRQEFKKAHSGEECGPLEASRRLIIRAFFGYGGDSACAPNRSTGFRAYPGTQTKSPDNVWKSYPDSLDAVVDRLQGVIIENVPALDLIDKWDREDSLFYLDPPYVETTREVRDNYAHEMSLEDHEKLVEKAADLKGSVLLSGYDNEIYNNLGWKKITRETYADAGQSDNDRKRQEVLWINPRAAAKGNQLNLFGESNV